jgi:hypothetical protein
MGGLLSGNLAVNCRAPISCPSGTMRARACRTGVAEPTKRFPPLRRCVPDLFFLGFALLREAAYFGAQLLL